MITDLVRLTRPYYSLPLAGGLIVISFYAAGGDFSGMVLTLILAFLSLLSILSGGYVLNDICDIQVDQINCPERVLPQEKVSIRLSKVTSGLLFVLGLTLSYFCGWKFFWMLTTVAVGIIAYDFFSKKMGLFKNVLVAILTTSLYPLALALTDPVMTSRVKVLLIHPVWLFLTTLGYEMLKDIQDTKGDAVVANPRLTALRSSPMFLLSARMMILLSSLLTLLPYVLGYCNTIYLAASIMAVLLAVLSWKQSGQNAIRCIYAEVFIITAGSLVDLLVYGP